MKKIVLTFGLIAGSILSAMLLIALRFQDDIGFDRGMVIGYITFFEPLPVALVVALVSGAC